jgi:preprotein translocase subunit SecG
LGIGILLLLIGLINYINIHLVVMIHRRKEFGLKKVFGAGSGSIFVQLCVENLVCISTSASRLLFLFCFQYFITMGMIVVSLFFVRQLNFMSQKDINDNQAGNENPADVIKGYVKNKL